MEDSRLEVRPLDSTDVDAIVELNRLHGTIMRHAKPDSYDDTFERSLTKVYLNQQDDCHFTIGAFNADRLECCISLYLWRAFPHYTLHNLKIRPGAVNLFSARNALGVCIGEVLKLTEDRAYFRGYLLRSLDRWPAEKIIRRLKEGVPRLRRYQLLSEALVPKETRPTYPFVWQMMGNRVWKQDLLVESLTLEQQHRPPFGVTRSFPRRRQ